MTAPTLVVDHPDDVAARRALAAELRRCRLRLGMTQDHLARILGITGEAVRGLEKRRDDSWQVMTVATRARALGRRLSLTLTGVEVPEAVYSRAEVERLVCLPVDADVLAVRLLVADLVRVRLALGLTLAELGVRLGCSESGAHRRERTSEVSRLATLQQHARALGGVLVVEVLPS
ncbi:hypothetical protein ABZ949_02485 [Micromonospora tulbaghiae]|uniref:hypothetical protein n=1 Tax=Micromonospora tulbaghiae TaxID=479978 RepID=UPI0033C299F5